MQSDMQSPALAQDAAAPRVITPEVIARARDTREALRTLFADVDPLTQAQCNALTYAENLCGFLQYGIPLMDAYSPEALEEDDEE